MDVIDVTGSPTPVVTPLVLVLAAGAGTRMGGPKVFARVRGGAFCTHISQTLRTLGWPAVWVLREKGQLRELADHIDMQPDFCINSDPAGDMLSSISVALSAPAARLSLVFCIWPVDFPLILPETLQKLAGSLDNWEAVLPANNTCTGHPLIVRRHILCRWLSSMPPDGLRQAMAENPAGVRAVAVADPGPFSNLNTPQDCTAAETPGDG